MKRLTFATLAVAFLSVAALAQASDPIAQRKALLKEIGDASREPGAMLRNQQPFELAKVQAFLRIAAANAERLPALFPAGSLVGDTAALPIIDTQRAEFAGIFANLQRTATAAQASITDEASFRANFTTVAANCGTCHRVYRRPQT